MRKVLKALLILQEVSNEGRAVKIGRGFFTARRLNPWNPLSYLFVLIVIIVGLLMYGFVGVWDEMDVSNPFKWN